MKIKPQKSGIYFNKQFGFYLYDADEDVLMSLCLDHDNTVGLVEKGYLRDNIEYVCHDLTNLLMLLRRYDNVPEYIKWTQTHLRS
jgi:hypothetical protein